MPAEKDDIPSTLERSPDKVRRTYEKTLDSAEEQYDGDEERAHRTAWAAVKNVAEKKGDHWELKEDGGTPTGPSDPRAEQSSPENRDHPARSYGGVDVNKPKRELEADAREAGIEGRSTMTKAELAEALQHDNDRRTAEARSS
jgi:cation transport regulator ChaB